MLARRLVVQLIVWISLAVAFAFMPDGVRLFVGSVCFGWCLMELSEACADWLVGRG